MAAITVIRAGMLTTVQDLGRWGQQHLGVPVAGPMDWYSHRLANRLVGNDVPLDRADADRAVQLRRLVPAASVVGTTVAVAAERVAADVASAVVEVLTSDVADISALAAHVQVRMDVVSL